MAPCLLKHRTALWEGRERTAGPAGRTLSQSTNLIRRISKAEEKRNAIIHSQWAMGDSDETLTRIKTTAKMSKGLRHQFEQVSLEDLKQIAEEIADVASEFQMFSLRQPSYDTRES